ncbi:MAG: hypothetical protein ACKV2Q_29540 [Planctomycetaceae bacterium]
MNCDYFLFSHLYENNLNDLSGNKNEWLRDLVVLLEASDFPGMVVLFYDRGWQELVRGTLLGGDVAAALAVAEQAARTAERVEAAAQSLSSQAGSRVLVVTALDLLPLVQRLGQSCAGVTATKLANFLGTNFSGARYDFPKLIEAFLRLRNLGGCPVLRIDQDVLFNTSKYPGTELHAPLGLAESVRTMVGEYRRRCALADSPAFLMTGRYLNSAGTTVNDWSRNDWLGAFATRPFPALAVDSTGEPLFHAPTLQAYYGVDDSASHLKIDGEGLPAGLSRIGAPPVNSPISGSLLTFNAPLVIEAPPFCNFRTNVVWIDDFLKFAMHRELHRLPNTTVSSAFSNSPLIATCETVKERPPISNARSYTLENYLPALVRGCVVDAWIQPDARTKVDFSAAASSGPLIRHLQAARQHGGLGAEQARSCRAELSQSASVRLNEVRDQWARLPSVGDLPSLATEWSGRGELSSLIGLETLLEDTLEYIEWAVVWPVVTDAVRALPRGFLKFDLL